VRGGGSALLLVSVLVSVVGWVSFGDIEGLYGPFRQESQLARLQGYWFPDPPVPGIL